MNKEIKLFIKKNQEIQSITNALEYYIIDSDKNAADIDYNHVYHYIDDIQAILLQLEEYLDEQQQH